MMKNTQNETQTFTKFHKGKGYRLFISKAREQYTRIQTEGGFVPFKIARMAVKESAWLNSIPCKCLACRDEYPIKKLTEGGYCWDCSMSEN